MEPTIVDKESTYKELYDSVMAELDKYSDGIWKPERIAITKSRINYLIRRAQQEITEKIDGR